MPTHPFVSPVEVLVAVGVAPVDPLAVELDQQAVVHAGPGEAERRSAAVPRASRRIDDAVAVEVEDVVEGGRLRD